MPESSASGTTIRIRGADNEHDRDDLARVIVSDRDCFTDELPARYVHAPAMARQILIGGDSVA